MVIAQEVRRRRKEAGLTQRQLGDLVGVNKHAVCNLENARTLPTIETLIYYSRALKCRVADLVAGVE